MANNPVPELHDVSNILKKYTLTLNKNHILRKKIIDGLNLYGKDWEKIALYCKMTRKYIKNQGFQLKTSLIAREENLDEADRKVLSIL